jgi:uncharacterized protein (DUF2249 family)
MSNKTVELDVCEDIRNGREPFSRIMSAVAALRPDEQLLLIAPFEPVPLFQVMEKRGFRHAAKPVKDGLWKVLFIRQPASEENPLTPAEGDHGVSPGAGAAVYDPNAQLVDARGLEPPQPMVRILEALASLPDNSTLCARTDRRPMHLYAQLEARGFVGETEEQSDGTYVTQIHRR